PRTDIGVGVQLRTIFKLLVVDKKLTFEHTQAVKFRKQQSRRVAGSSHGIIRMILLPLRKNAVGAIEVQVVEKLKSVIEGWYRKNGISGCSMQRCKRNERRHTKPHFCL